MTKKVEKYNYEESGLVIVVKDSRGCETFELICSEAPMKTIKSTYKKRK